DERSPTLFERGCSYFLSPEESFVHKQRTSGILLVAYSIIACVLSSFPCPTFLLHIHHVRLWLTVVEWEFSLLVNDWISQRLMTLFFFLTGLELKREIIAGKLSETKEIKLVCASALGGILVPSLFYFLINRNGPGEHGWGIPTATDTAFA